MLVTIITAENYLKAREQILKILHQTDAIELRLDYWQKIDITEVQKLREQFTLPTIFTLRKQSQGGLFVHDESLRLGLLFKLCECRPDYIDIEYDVPKNFFDQVKTLFPKINIVCSYHDFVKTPDNLQSILQAMQASEAHIYKIAVFAQSTLDALRALIFLKTNLSCKITAISMGEAGVITRIAGKILGNFFNFAAYDNENLCVHHQLTLEQLRTIYHVHQLNEHTVIYALLGNPIDKSVGHLLHNQAIRFLNINAVYVKLNVGKEMLAEAQVLLKQLPFAGFSVTMPLKSEIIPTQVINTVTQKNSFWEGTNTDGLGAILAIKKITTLHQKKIVILGAGGTAKAIADAACQEGAEIVIFNRTLNKAQLIAEEVGGCVYSLNAISEIKNLQYDLLINTLPIEVPIEVKDFIRGTYVMDCVYQPIDTNFLKKAKTAGCFIIPGFQLYIEQALLQLKTWFNPTEDQLSHIKSNMLNFFKVYTSATPVEPVANNP